MTLYLIVTDWTKSNNLAINTLDVEDFKLISQTVRAARWL